MKILAKPEGRPNIFLPDRDSLKKWIKSKNFDGIHNFIVGPIMLGADYEVESVCDDIDRADKVALMLGEECERNLWHALALIFPNPERLEIFDIGDVTEADLEVKN